MMKTNLSLTTETLDAILHLQFRVAWAGEALCDPPRLKWWRTDLVDEMSGGDFMRRLAPRTHRWAALEGVREAARLTDLKARQRLADPDSARTLFFWGFEMDELLSDRLREQKMALATAPDQGEFSREALEKEFKVLAPDAAYTVLSSGRELKAERPEAPLQAAWMLTACLTPFSQEYPVPFFRVRT